MNCADIESRLTRYVDDETDAADRATIGEHLSRCSPCQRIEERERLGRAIVRTRAAHVTDRAPIALRHKCAAIVAVRRQAWSWARLVAAAVLLLGLGLAGVTVLKPVPAFAAQLAVDHWKCSHLGPSLTSSDPRVCEREWLASQGWSIVVPSGGSAGMTLLGLRRCFVTEGRMAHLLYDRRGEAVSVFVLADASRFAPATLEVFGHEAVMWTSGGRTYAVVARGDRASVEGLAAELQRELATASGITGS
jgi:anti-sigma factor RsiW